MKTQIRREVFETNSSSTHAICIPKKYDAEVIKHNLNDNQFPYVQYFRPEEYGWEFDVLTEPNEKANYLYTAIVYLGGDYRDRLQELSDILEKAGVKAVYDDDMINHCCIDHVGDLDEWIECMFKFPEDIINYLYGNAFVVTGNDNSDEWFDYMYIDTNEIDEYGEHVKESRFNKDYYIYEKWN